MKSIMGLLAVGIFGISAAYAQSSSSLTGQWTGTTKSPVTGADLQIQVLISDAKSVWKFSSTQTARRPNPCFDREFPLTVKSGASDKFVFNVDGPSVIQGCAAFFVNLELTDTRTLSGAFGDGRSAILKKI